MARAPGPEPDTSARGGPGALAIREGSGGPTPRVLRVGELVAELRTLVEDGVGRVWVVGELSNVRRVASGHVYFTLKDDDAQLRAVLFRADAARLPFELEDGLAVLAWGDVTVYGPRGDLQLVARQLEPRGRGALRLAFEQLRARLEHEGLFEAARKRPLPPFPRAIGVVTSAHGAAVRDVIEVTRARWPHARLVVAAARVQGDGAEIEIVEALQQLAVRPGIDVILLVRGGGSLEELAPFDSEAVARAVARCPRPVVAGIGHETDVTIADLVADARGATPSAAAALAVPDRRAVVERVGRDRRRLVAALAARLARARAALEARRGALERASPRARVAARGERLGRDARRLRAAAALLLERARASVALAAGRLDLLSPLAVLGRGYAIARRASDGAIVRDPRDVAPGDELAVRVAGGAIDARVLAARRLADR